MPKLKGGKELDIFKEEKDWDSKIVRKGMNEWGHRHKQVPDREGPGGQGFVSMKLECNGSDLHFQKNCLTVVGHGYGRSVHESRETT